MWIKRITLPATVIFALISLARGAHATDSCSDMALAIAMSSKLESGGLSKDGSLIQLIGDPYAAYLSCSGPAGMSLLYVGPNPPPDDWYAFVSKTGSVLTERRPALVRSAVEWCLKELQQSSELVANVRSKGFEVLCDTEKSGRHVEVVVTQRVRR